MPFDINAAIIRTAAAIQESSERPLTNDTLSALDRLNAVLAMQIAEARVSRDGTCQ